MKTFGIIVFLVGIIVAIIGFSLETTVTAYNGEKIYNIGQTHISLITVILGCSLFITGSILLSVGSIIEKIQIGPISIDSNEPAINPYLNPIPAEEVIINRKRNKTIALTIIVSLSLTFLVVFLISRV